MTVTRRRTLGKSVATAAAVLVGMVVAAPAATAAVATPTVTSTNPASPSPSTKPLVKGSAQSGSTVTLYSDSSCSRAALGSGSAASFAGSGITATVPANATTRIYAKATISGQTPSACSSSSVSYTSDSTAPGLVTLTAVTPASPSSSTAPTVKGTAEAGSTVRIYTTSGCTGSAAASGTASAFAASGLSVAVPANATTTFRATATDAAGNTSACSTSTLTYTNDSTPPGLVALTGVTPASPSTSTAPVVTGTAEAGSTVTIYATAACTGSPVATGTAAALASPGLTVTVPLGSVSTFRARARDAAGNTSACSSRSVSYTSDLSDGGFEAATGNPPDSPGWVETDSLAWPLCTVDTCTPGDEVAPRTGRAWAWFGGLPDAGHTGSLTQTVTLPTGPVALTFWYRNSSVSAPYDAQLLVRVDGRTLRTITEASTAQSAYSQQVVDLSAYADGAAHVISFSYSNGSGGGVNNMLVDDVSLRATSGARTATPIVGATSPASPSASATPRVTGTAEAGSSVTLYADAACAGPAIGAGAAADFAGAGIPVTVPVGTSLIFAEATKAGKDDSACSAGSATYTRLGPPDTTLTRKPKQKITTSHRKVKVVFAFASSVAGASFECSVDGKAFTACTSGQKYKVKAGKHTFAVRALALGLTDPTPATFAFAVKHRHRAPR